MIGRHLVVLVYCLAEDYERVSDKKVRNVICEELVYSMIYQTFLDVFVKRQVVIVVLGSVGRMCRKIAIHAIVA
jgi:hypothetical protein